MITYYACNSAKVYLLNCKDCNFYNENERIEAYEVLKNCEWSIYRKIGNEIEPVEKELLNSFVGNIVNSWDINSN